MKAVIFGTGRIACGCAGQMLYESGYDLVFIGRNREVVAHLERTRCYDVRLVDHTGERRVHVDGIRAIASTDTARAAEEIASADLVVTAVGAENLTGVARVLAPGLARRQRPVSVCTFENLADSGATLRALVAPRMRSLRKLSMHAFVSTLVERVVARRVGDPDGHTPFEFIGDPWPTVRVDASAFQPLAKPVTGMIVSDDYNAWVHRKLYTYSAGHATAAYLGNLKGYHFVHTAVRDPEIRAAVLEAMDEGQRGLLGRYGREVAGDPQDLAAILERFENAALSDPIRRVGRDPRRKLASDERLVGAARLAEAAGVKPDHLALATAAAMYFDSADPSAASLQQQIETAGARATVTSVSGLNTQRGLGRLVVSDCRQIARGWHPGNLLLTLTPLRWAWMA